MQQMHFLAEIKNWESKLKSYCCKRHISKIKLFGKHKTIIIQSVAKPYQFRLIAILIGNVTSSTLQTPALIYGRNKLYYVMKFVEELGKCLLISSLDVLVIKLWFLVQLNHINFHIYFRISYYVHFLMRLFHYEMLRVHQLEQNAKTSNNLSRN